MKNKLIIALFIIVAVSIVGFSRVRRGIPEVTLQTCGGVYVLASYDQPYPIPVGQLDVADATVQWSAEGCTDIVFKPAGDGNFFGYGTKIGFAE